jgi:hypothetical protein
MIIDAVESDGKEGVKHHLYYREALGIISLLQESDHRLVSSGDGGEDEVE